ncbi:YjjG family noncanonical pyrimidine nucleotidase [Proteocatella sphenisci]|uniref:YjjG family noncanonical pyrimidine nucleotidase n=1 Tax=Proteocatella sphenisci TaxID=181070 RepID=UPI00048AF862|nr:YjjG family noncanonical pyrimidine nucleotidase [Proteocatella sphenisci]
MIKYNTIMFDVDDTILDFKRGEEVALKSLLGEIGAPQNSHIISEYRKINKMLWRDFEKGDTDRDYIFTNRFTMLFKKYGIEVDGVQMEQKYRSYLDMQHEQVDGACEVLDYLHSKCLLYVVTNGVSSTQYKRLSDANMNRYFDKIFVSDDIGYQKPMREFFETVTAEIPEYDPKKTLIVGDSLGADILGGINVGIDTCWLNRFGEEASEIVPNYEIKSLNEIFNIVKK